MAVLLFWDDGAIKICIFRLFAVIAGRECFMEVFLDDSAATENLGKALGRLLANGDVVCLTGGLGAGKTLLAKGAAAALGAAAEEVTSPTFTIMNVYQGRKLEIRHFDLYRLNRSEELEDIGFAEYAGGDGVTLIEWAELFAAELPEEYLQITLQREGGGRRAVIEARGGRYKALLQHLEKEYGK